MSVTPFYSTTATGTVSGPGGMAGMYHASVDSTRTASGSGGIAVSDSTAAGGPVADPGGIVEVSTTPNTTSDSVLIGTPHSSKGVDPGVPATLESTDVMSTVTKLFQVQMEAMAAQARAAAVQHLPALRCYTGEGIGMLWMIVLIGGLNVFKSEQR